MTADPTAESVERAIADLNSSLSKEFPGVGEMRTSASSASLRNVLARLQAAEQECERLRQLVSSSEQDRYRACGELLARAETAEAKSAALDADYRAVCGFMLDADSERTAPVEEATGLVEGTAKAIAENGFGRPWDDFLPLNAHDTDQGDLIEYAQAAVDFLSAVPPSQGVEKLDMRKVVEALGFEPDNHHNALKCPYCTPEIAAPEPRSGDVVELVERALKQARRPTHYPDYLDDPEGFERLREAARTKDGHAFTACNNNSVWRLVETIERLKRAVEIAASPVQGGAL